MAISSSLFDKRVVRRSIKKGLIDPEQYQRVLDELPDRSNNIYVPEPSREPAEPAGDAPVRDREARKSSSSREMASSDATNAAQEARSAPFGDERAARSRAGSEAVASMLVEPFGTGGRPVISEPSVGALDYVGELSAAANLSGDRAERS